MTSKRVKEAVDKLRPPVVVKASKTFIKPATALLLSGCSILFSGGSRQ
jgi:hypothetical protein